MVPVICILRKIEYGLFISTKMALTRDVGINCSSFFVKSSRRCPCFTRCIKVLLATEFLAGKLPYSYKYDLVNE